MVCGLRRLLLILAIQDNRVLGPTRMARVGLVGGVNLPAIDDDIRQTTTMHGAVASFD